MKLTILVVVSSPRMILIKCLCLVFKVCIPFRRKLIQLVHLFRIQRIVEDISSVFLLGEIEIHEIYFHQIHEKKNFVNFFREFQ